MRAIQVILANKYATSIFCDEVCDRCSWRFLCFTTKHKDVLEVTPNARDLRYYMVVDNLLENGTHLMRCPHCSAIFMVKNDQYMNNTKFKCGKCGKFNWGSREEDEYGILIGCPWDGTLDK